MRLSLASTVALVAFSAVAHAQTTWTVDDSGGADFTSAQTAVDTVAPGDILLIMPGSYGTLDVTKQLTLLGDPDGPRPQFDYIYAADSPHIDLMHLETQLIFLINLSERSRVDDCLITGLGNVIDLCDDTVITRTRFVIPDGIGHSSFPTLQVWNSRLQFVGCEVPGEDTHASGGTAGWGGNAIWAIRSELLLVGSLIRGGDGEDRPSPGFDPGKGGLAIDALDSTTVEVRGSSTDLLRGGYQSAGTPGGAQDGLAVAADATSAATISGVTVVGGYSGAVQTVAPRPYLRIPGTDGPLGTRTVEVYGDAGSPAVVAASTHSAYLDAFSPLLGLPVFFDIAQPASMVPLTLLGQDLAASFDYLLPADPSLAGTALTAQAVAVGTGLQATNCANVILSF